MKSINNYKGHGEELYIFKIPPQYYDDPYKSDIAKQKNKQIKKQLRCHIINIRIYSYLTTTKGILLKLLIAKWYDTCRFLLIPLLLVYLGTVRNKKKHT